MILDERDGREAAAVGVARKMLTAARTAPKAKGQDIIECCAVTGAEKHVLADKLRELGEERGLGFFLRDAGNVDEALAVVLVGTKARPCGLNCGRCGYARCAEKPAQVPCELNAVDVGIALGSACSCAMDEKVDTRVLFSAGVAAQELGLCGEGVGQVYAILLGISSKNAFFDRKPKKD